MTYGTLEEIAVVRRYLDLDDFREALEQAPPGIIDERSWAYLPRPCLGALFQLDAPLCTEKRV